MAEKSRTVHVVELNANAKHLQETLVALRKSFGGMTLPPDLEKTFTKLENAISSVIRKTEKGIIPREDFQDTERELTKVKNGFDALSSSVETLKKASDKRLFSMLPEDTVQKLNAAKKAYTDYSATLATVVKAEQDLEKAERKRKEAEDAAGSASRSASAYKGKVTAAKEQLAKYKEITDALKEQEEATKELEEATKELEKAKKSGMGERGLATRRARVEEATTKKAAADTKVGGFSKKDIKAQADATEKVRVATEKYEAAQRAAEDATKAKTSAEVAAQSAANNLANAQNKSAEDAQKQAQALATLKSALEAVNPKFKGMVVEGKTTTEQLANLRNIVDGLTDDELAKLKVQLGQVDTTFDKVEDSLEGLKNGFQQTKQAVKETDEAFAQQQAFENKIKQFLGLSGAAQVLRSALRDALQTITELDATMTEMAVVTDLTVGDYWDQLPEYSKQASDLGVSINSAYKAATLYYQQGLKGNEVTKISAETLKMAKIAGLDAADATNKMTAALRGFNMELNETSAQRVSDVYSELAAITAADVDEISNAMTKTASIAHSAGMEFETTAAFLSQIIETTRESAETAGTALKTVIARFQELKKDPAEIGEVDGEIVDANKIETALRSVGVALRDSSGQFRELDDVFLELSSKWDGLDKNTQRYIATIAAGSRQQSRFIAMMSDYGRTQELVASANNSAGASQKQFEKTTESLEYKVERLKNAWHEFTMGIMNSDLLKFGVDILSKFLEIVNKATSALDGVGGSLTKIISVVAVFKLASKVFGMIKQPLISFFADVVKMSREEGEKAGQAFDDGARKGATQKKQDPKDKKPQSIKSWVGNKTGVTDIKEGLRAKKDAQNAIRQKRAQQQAAQSRYNAARENAYKNPDELISARKELAKVNKEYKDSLDASYKASNQLASGMQKAGQAAMGMGMAISMVGGALSSAGFEEAGNAVSQLGNWIMIAGTAISAMGPIISAVSKLAQKEGITTMAAWGWVLLIVAGIAILVGGIIAIYAQIQNNSPEKKLEKAQQAAEGAAQGAERAAEAYNNLNDSLNSLEEQQKTLEGLTRGTDEWNKAVQDVNSSVLELIEKYPELAGFVENEGGVLTLDVDSSEAKDVMNAYKQDELIAKGASIGAKANLARANAEYDLSKMDDSVFEKFQTDGQGAAVATAFGNMLAAGAVGAGGGALTGAGIGGLAGSAMPGIGNLVGAGAGAAWGAIIGGATGLVAGIASFQYTVDQVEKNNEQNRQNVKELAQAYANGETGETVEEIAAYIERNGIAMGDAVEQMANSLIEESATMREYGETLNALGAQEKAYYQAMATNAQQLLDLGSMTEQAMNQINTVVDEDLMKDYEDAEKERLQKEAEGSNSEEFDKEKENFAKSVYGENAKVDGNKILNEKGEVIREFDDDEAWINEMAAANATLKAAEAMEQIPGAILNSIKNLEPELQKVFSKAFEGKDLTKSELEDFSQELGAVTYKDENGNVAKSWNELDQGTKNIWGSEEAYLKSLDADYSGIDTMWNQLTPAQKKAYGWSGDANDTESLNKAKEAYEATFTEILESQTKAFQEAEAAASDLGITLASQLSAGAAQAWTSSLKEISLGATEGEIDALNESLTTLLSSMSAEQADLVMAEINAMDKMDINAWNNLEDVLNTLPIEYNTDALRNFAVAGIAAYNAIEKIDFDNLAKDINDIYTTINKAKQGERKYNETDYKEMVAANKDLEKSFVQIGDEFVYIGGSIDELPAALEENTMAKLNEANRQLKSRSEMSSIIAEKSNTKYGDIGAMGDFDLMTYLTDMASSAAAKNLDLKDFGIAGLSNTTDFSKATSEQLKQWAEALAVEGGKQVVYENDYAKGLKQANIVRFTGNDAFYNATMAAGDSEYADAHQQALLTQAVQSGAVHDELIQAYQDAIETGNKDQLADIGEKIAEQVGKVVEDSAGRDGFNDFTSRVVDALEKQRQDAIDKLSEINDSINSANDKLVGKIQEQINDERTARQQEQAQQNIANMQSQQAYLAMDTSGANALEVQELNTQIADAEQEHIDALVDQAIQNLQDANEKAAEQRERQISIAEQQLQNDIESGRLTEEAAQIVTESIESLKEGTAIEETVMGDLLSSEVLGLDEADRKKWTSDLNTQATQVANWLGSEEKPKPQITGQVQVADSIAGVTDPEQQKNNAIAAAKKSLMSATGGGFRVQSQDENSDFMKAYNSYKSIAGNENVSAEDFAKLAAGEDYRKYDYAQEGEITTRGNNFNWNDAANNKEEDGPIKLSNGTEYRVRIKGSSSTAAAAAKAQNINENECFTYGTGGYIYHGGVAYKIIKSKKSGKWQDFTGFATGGLADFTGPAWLDGTKSRPEYVLNADQTERFFSLVDVLEGYDKDKKLEKSGDNYFEIEINVEKLESDYDVEQVANKIRKMIYEDAMYRNVNAINNMR